MINKIKLAFENYWEKILDNAPAIIIGLVLLAVFIVLAYGLRALAKRRLTGRMDDQLLVNFIGRIVFIVMIVIGFIIFLNQIGLGGAAGGLLAGAGVSAIVIGFAFKDIGENFLAGFFLAFGRPFGIGDIIEVDGLKGTVVALHFRNTHIRTFDGKDIFLPNASLIKNALINYTRDGLLRHDFVVGLDYGDDVIAASQLIQNILLDEKRIEQKEGLKPFLILDEFGTSTVNIRIYYWINYESYTGSIPELKTELMNNVVVALAKEGYSMPADIIELKIYQEGQPIPINLNPKKKQPLKA